MLTHTFDSQIEIGEQVVFKADEMTVKNEPMLYQCSYTEAMVLGGPLTATFLSALRQHLKQTELDNLIIDSRVHMLMKNWYPCISGMHHDLVPRTRIDKQPNYINPEYHSRHCMMLVNGDIAPTEFAIGKADFPEVPIGEIYYRKWHPIVIDKINNGELKKVSAPSNRLIFFDWQTWHQGVKAIGNGWRFFIRASWNHTETPKNELRKQVQIYMDQPNDGW